MNDNNLKIFNKLCSQIKQFVNDNCSPMNLDGGDKCLSYLNQNINSIEEWLDELEENGDIGYTSISEREAFEDSILILNIYYATYVRYIISIIDRICKKYNLKIIKQHRNPYFSQGNIDFYKRNKNNDKRWYGVLDYEDTYVEVTLGKNDDDEKRFWIQVKLQDELKFYHGQLFDPTAIFNGRDSRVEISLVNKYDTEYYANDDLITSSFIEIARFLVEMIDNYNKLI